MIYKTLDKNKRLSNANPTNNSNNTTNVTGTGSPSGAPEFNPVFS